jgi:chemotaxis response regulator CheB
MVVAEEPDITVAWTAADGEEAVRKCRQERPDMILMDIVMPHVDGVEATRRIMLETPCPILIVTASIGANVSAAFEAMGAGAVDVVATPQVGEHETRRMLLEKIRQVAAYSDNPAPVDFRSRKTSRRTDACVLIGSSAGGPAALTGIISALPADLKACIAIVQHIDERFSTELAAWLGENSSLPVRLAEDGDEVTSGKILVARGGRHLVFGPGRRFRYQDQPRLSYQPSVDVLFESAVSFGPPRLLGILLTGMGRDGAAGLRQLREAGHLTIAQDQKSSAIYGMPRAAVELGAASEILSPSQIAERIASWSRNPCPR